MKYVKKFHPLERVKTCLHTSICQRLSILLRGVGLDSLLLPSDTLIVGRHFEEFVRMSLGVS
jgi:hypothetical protein